MLLAKQSGWVSSVLALDKHSAVACEVIMGTLQTPTWRPQLEPTANFCHIKRPTNFMETDLISSGCGYTFVILFLAFFFFFHVSEDIICSNILMTIEKTEGIDGSHITHFPMIKNTKTLSDVHTGNITSSLTKTKMCFYCEFPISERIIFHTLYFHSAQVSDPIIQPRVSRKCKQCLIFAFQAIVLV